MQVMEQLENQRETIYDKFSVQSMTRTMDRTKILKNDKKSLFNIGKGNWHAPSLFEKRQAIMKQLGKLFIDNC